MSISKINLIQEIEFLERFEKIGDILLKWSEKSGDKNLKVCKILSIQPREVSP